VVLLMFSIGVEFSVPDLMRVKWVALGGGTLGIILSMALAVFVSWIAGWGIIEGIVIGATISVASTMVLARLLTDRGALTTSYGSVMIGITLVEDEIDKPTGYLKVDRPHKYSSLCPSIYGFLPQTYCGGRVAERAMERNPSIGKIHGDGDPIDICVLSTRDIKHGDLILSCRPIGGLRMIDDGEADDKIVAVLVGDPLMSGFTDITHIPKSMLDMLRHYFLTYKQSPDVEAPKVSIPEVYGREEAYEMIRRSMADYQDKFVSLKKDFAKSIMSSLRRELAASLASD